MEKMPALIKKAKRAYLLALNAPKRAEALARFSIYLDDGHGLHLLWPLTSKDETEARLPWQVEYGNDRYPCFHFAARKGDDGAGNALDKIGVMLRAYNPKIDIYRLEGWNPRPVIPGL